MNNNEKNQAISKRPKCRWIVVYLHPINSRSYKASPCSSYEKAIYLGAKWKETTKGLGHFTILDLNNVSEVNYG